MLISVVTFPKKKKLLRCARAFEDKNGKNQFLQIATSIIRMKKFVTVGVWNDVRIFFVEAFGAGRARWERRS